MRTIIRLIFDYGIDVNIGDGYVLVHNSKCGDFKKIDPTVFESNNNLPKGTFHRTIKPKIISKAKPNYKVQTSQILCYKKELKGGMPLEQP